MKRRKGRNKKRSNVDNDEGGGVKKIDVEEET